jgi:hypothetical protein
MRNITADVCNIKGRKYCVPWNLPSTHNFASKIIKISFLFLETAKEQNIGFECFLIILENFIQFEPNYWHSVQRNQVNILRQHRDETG